MQVPGRGGTPVDVGELPHGLSEHTLVLWVLSVKSFTNSSVTIWKVVPEARTARFILLPKYL